MNYENSTKLADFIKGRKVDMANVISDPRRGHGFTSDRFVKSHAPDCETAACALGWGKFYLAANKVEFQGSDAMVGTWLGLDIDDQCKLFTPYGYYIPLSQRKQGIRLQKVLRGQIKLTDDWLHNPVRA